MEAGRMKCWQAGLWAVAVTYGPFLGIGIFGFSRDPSCCSQWWKMLPLLPGLAPSFMLMQAPGSLLRALPRALRPGWLTYAVDRFQETLRAGPDWMRLLLPGLFSLVLLMAVFLLLRAFGQRSRARWFILIGAFLLAGTAAGLAYAMFLA